MLILKVSVTSAFLLTFDDEKIFKYETVFPLKQYTILKLYVYTLDYEL